MKEKSRKRGARDEPMTGREESMTGWVNPLRESKHELLGEINQQHISKGIGHHFHTMLGSRNWQQMKGGRRLG